MRAKGWRNEDLAAFGKIKILWFLLQCHSHSAVGAVGGNEMWKKSLLFSGRLIFVLDTMESEFKINFARTNTLKAFLNGPSPSSF